MSHERFPLPFLLLFGSASVASAVVPCESGRDALRVRGQQQQAVIQRCLEARLPSAATLIPAGHSAARTPVAAPVGHAPSARAAQPGASPLVGAAATTPQATGTTPAAPPAAKPQPAAPAVQRAATGAN